MAHAERHAGRGLAQPVDERATALVHRFAQHVVFAGGLGDAQDHVRDRAVVERPHVLRLYAAEDATLHAIFKDKGSKVRAKVGDASEADLEEMSDPQKADGVWWSRVFQGAKPQLAPDPLNPGRTLRLTVDRNDMSDLVLVLTTTTQARREIGCSSPGKSLRPWHGTTTISS